MTSGLRVPPGLCGVCTHALVRTTARGTTYLRCGMAAVDPRFARYPNLPVHRCPGFELATPPPEPDGVSAP